MIGFFELGIRTVEERLPTLSEWPTVETEVKSAQLAALADQLTVVFVGTSVTESGVDPAQLVSMGAAEGAYNAAFPFYSPAAADVWLTEITTPWSGLEYLIIGIAPAPPPRHPSDDPLFNGLLRRVAAEPTEEPALSLALWRLRGVLADAEEAARRDKTRSENLWTELGHQTLYYEDSEASQNRRLREYGVPAMSEYQERAVRHLVTTAQDAGVTPVLVVEPGAHPRVLDGELVDAYIDWLRVLGDDLGVELWDAYNIDWDASLYADETHLNRKGTAAYTEYIGRLLMELDQDQ